MDTGIEGNTFNINRFLRSHIEFVVIGILVGFYLFVSNYFVWGVAFTNGVINTSGGSDPYYNWRIISYIVHYKHELLFDPALNYPLGAANPRNPFFHWFIVFVAQTLLAPFVGLNQGAYYVFNEFDAAFGAFLIVPVYLITKEIFGRRAGFAGAVLYVLMPSNLSSGILADGRMHTPELIFAFFTIYFFLRAINLSKKTRILEKLTDIRSFVPSLLKFYENNRMPTIYALLSGASLGGLMLSWQGYPYIEVIVLIYVVIQLIVNVISRKPTGYLTYYTALFVGLSFLMGAYYYIGAGFWQTWFNDPMYMGILIVGLGVLFNIVGRRPWLLTIPSIIIVSALALLVLNQVSPSIVHELLTGQGYFIKNRVYQTIGEAQAPPLGQYISGFGAAQFLLGMSGVAFIIYRYMKEKKDGLLFIIVFSLVSIYMSFAAARFNITAAPAYAALGGGILIYFAETIDMSSIRKRKVMAQPSVRKAIKGNISWLHAVFATIVVLLVIIPSGMGVISASIPPNNAAQLNNEIHYSLPSFLRAPNYTSTSYQYVGGASAPVVNNTNPLSQSLNWLATQDTNLSLDQRPAYVSWWDYGFQELYQGQHPTVADDFQQGYQVAGQILLAQNQTQIISLFLSRVLQGALKQNNGQFTAAENATMNKYFGPQETSMIYNISRNPGNYISLIINNPSVYGKFIPSMTAANAYYALINGQLSSKYPTSTIVSAYSQLEQETGYSIQYIQVPNNLFPLSGLNPGIFYAPSYLTDTPSYSYQGEIVPTNYYQINAITANGTYPLDQLPAGAQILNETIQYTPAFYNTSIYRFMIGYPASATGNTNGIPGYDYGSTQYQMMPAWNMSHFEISYLGIPYNPYTDYQAHPNAWQLYVPLQQAYQYQQEGKGTTVIFPPTSQYIGAANPIVSYYPGAEISGHVTTQSGKPVQGLYVTIFDQYGIPHQYTTTNKNGFYNLTGLPGNDTILISSGNFNKLYLTGTNTITGMKVQVSKDQAERIPTSYNLTTGLPSYHIVENYVVKPASVSGFARIQYQQVPQIVKGVQNPFKTTNIQSGFVLLHNQTYDVNYTIPIINGNYSMNDILPYSYQASIISNGVTYKDFQYVNVTLGGTQVYNLYIQYDPVFVKVALNGMDMPNYSVVATGQGYQTSGTTNASGGAILWVKPGNYSVYAYKSASRTDPSSVSFTGWGLNTTVNLTPAISAKLSGYIGNYTGPVNVSFYQDGVISSQYSAVATGGFYTTDLPVGVYTVYAKAQGKVYIQTVNLSRNTYLNFSLQKSYTLTLNSNIKGQSVYSGFYELLSPSVMLKYNYEVNRTFEIQVPEGSFMITALGTYVGNTEGAFKQVYVSSNMEQNLSLAVVNSKTVFVYNSDFATYSANSVIQNGIITLYVSGIPYFYSPVSSQGYATLLNPNGTAGQLSVGIQSAYYFGPIRSVSSSTVYYAANPVKSSVTLNIFNNSTQLSTNGVAELKGLTDYNITLSGGTGSSNVAPGIYYITIKTSNYELVPLDPVVAVPMNGSFSIDLNVEQLAAITVSGVANNTIYNSQGTSYSMGSSIPFGDYWVYSTNNTAVAITQVHLSGDVTISPTLVNGYVVNVTNSLSLTSGTYSVKTSGYSLNFTNGNIVLPYGSYNISYYNRLVNSTGAYIVQGYKQITIGGPTYLNISSTSQDVKTTVSGTVVYDESPSQYSEVEFLNSTGALVATTTTNANGYYSIPLSYASTYGVYVVNSPSSSSYLGSLTFSAFSQAVENNITLRPAYNTYISANIQDQLLKDNITIIHNDAKLLFNTTDNSLLLGLGNYTFSASQITSQYFQSTNTYRTIGYYTNLTEFINTSKYVHLTLQKSEIYGFITQQISPVVTINAGDNFSYVFSIQNTGNSPVNITLSSGNSTWVAQFNQSKAYLIPGQSMNFTVNFTSPVNAPAGNDTVPVTISYGTGTSTAPLYVNVTPFENFTVKEGATAGIPDGNTIKIPLIISNTGNEGVTVNLTLLDQTLISRSNWNATFVYDNQTVQQVNVSYNQTVTVYVLMVPVNQNAVSTLTFDVNFTGQSTNITKAVTMQYPSLSKINTYPTGSGIISNYTGNPFLGLEAGVLAIVLIVVIGLGIVAYRTRRKK